MGHKSSGPWLQSYVANDLNLLVQIQSLAWDFFLEVLTSVLDATDSMYAKSHWPKDIAFDAINQRPGCNYVIEGCAQTATSYRQAVFCDTEELPLWRLKVMGEVPRQPFGNDDVVSRVDLTVS
jgi:hypothetical protein